MQPEGPKQESPFVLPPKEAVAETFIGKKSNKQNAIQQIYELCQKQNRLLGSGVIGNKL